MKAYTDIEQSKELTEFLPLESADMWFHPYPNDEYWYDIPNIGDADIKYNQLPCWSLAALLDVLPDTMLGKDKDGYVVMAETMGSGLVTTSNNPINACYEMILKLKKQNLL